MVVDVLLLTLLVRCCFWCLLVFLLTLFVGVVDVGVGVGVPAAVVVLVGAVMLRLVF